MMSDVSSDQIAAAAWWDSLDPYQRACWLLESDSPTPFSAWLAFQRGIALIIGGE